MLISLYLPLLLRSKNAPIVPMGVPVQSPTSSMNWCTEDALHCDGEECFCTRRLDMSEPASGSGGVPVIESRAENGTTCPTCAQPFAWWILPLLLLLGLLIGLCLTFLCIPITSKRKTVTRDSELKPTLKFSEKKSLHAEFTLEQFRELRKMISLDTLVMRDDVECFTRQGANNEITYGTICKGWMLWQLHSSADDDEPDQSVDSVREVLHNVDGIRFPITGYFFVDPSEFDEAARRAQENEEIEGTSYGEGGGEAQYQRVENPQTYYYGY